MIKFRVYIKRLLLYWLTWLLPEDMLIHISWWMPANKQLRKGYLSLQYLNRFYKYYIIFWEEINHQIKTEELKVSLESKYWEEYGL